MGVIIRILHFLSVLSCWADGGLRRPCLLQTLFGEGVHEQQSSVFQCAGLVHWYQGSQAIPESTGSPDISICTGRKIILKLCLHSYTFASWAACRSQEFQCDSGSVPFLLSSFPIRIDPVEAHRIYICVKWAKTVRPPKSESHCLNKQHNPLQ